MPGKYSLIASHVLAGIAAPETRPGQMGAGGCVKVHPQMDGRKASRCCWPTRGEHGLADEIVVRIGGRAFIYPWL